MKSLGLIILTICCCYCSSSDIVNTKAYDFNQYYDNKLREALIQFKDTMKGNVSFFENKTLDPLEIEKAEFNIQEGHFVDLNATIEKFILKNLSDYDVKIAKLSLAGLIVSSGLFWNELNLQTKYDLNCIIQETYTVYGKGNISLKVEDFYFQITIKLSEDEGYLHIDILNSIIALKKFQFKITGLFNDEELSEVLSTIVSDTVPVLVDRYQKEITTFLNRYLEKLANKELRKVKLETILEMIT